MAEAGADVWQAARKRFGENLGLLRRAAGVKQGPLAGHLSVSVSTVSTVSALEQGVGAEPPDAELVERYVDYCLKWTKASQAVKDEKAWAIRDAREKLEGLHEHLHDLPGHRRGGASVSTLRRDVRAFTGREDELAVLVEAVERRKQGLIAVYAVDGMPGVGKTAFATHAAHQLSPRFPDGQLFVDLHGHSPVRSPIDPGEALTSLLTAVGVDPLAVPADLDSRSALWRTRLRGKRVLLVLDNVADHTQVEPLLPGEEQCLVLVTSRRRLVELDAVPIDLNPLTTGEAEKMFVDLATRPAEPEFEAEPEDMTRLAELCGRLPLAIAIVAARFRNRGTLTVARLVEELTEARNRLLALRARDRAVAAAFELSYRDLLPDRQLFFRRLGLHPGEDVERYGATALCGVELVDAAEHLDALYHEHLVEEIDYGRYRLHDLIAEYTRDLLSRDEPEPTAAGLESMLDFYQQTAGIAADLLVYGDGDGDPWFPGAVPPLADAQAAMDWFEHERANLLACLEIVEEPGRVVGFALALAPYLRRTGPWDLTLRLLRRAVEAAPATGDDTATGMTLLELGKAEFYADNYEEAQVALRAAGRVFAALGDDTCLAQAMSTLGQVWVQTGDHGDARGAYAQALAAHEKVGNRRLAAGVLVELGTLHYFEDEYAESVTANERALRIYKEVGDRDGQATALKGLGHAWLFSDDYERAHDAATRARELFRQARQRLGEAQTSSLLGSVGRARGQYPKAKEDFEQALEIYDELGDRAGAAMAKIELGIVLHHLGDFAAGERMLREALELYEEFGEPMGQASVCKELADLLTRTNRLPEARELLDEAEAIYEKLDDRLGKAGTSNSYGAWYLASGEPRTARSRHNEALRLALEIASPTEKASALAGLGRVARALGEHEAAERSFWDAYEIYLRIGSGEAADLARELGVDVTPSDEDEDTEGAGSGAAAH